MSDEGQTLGDEGAVGQAPGAAPADAGVGDEHAAAPPPSVEATASVAEVAVEAAAVETAAVETVAVEAAAVETVAVEEPAVEPVAAEPVALEAVAPEAPAAPYPVVAAVEPASGPQTLGAELVVRGEHFGAEPRVRVGTEPAELLRRTEDGALVVAAPPSARAGHVDVAVEVEAGGRALRGVLVHGFRWEPPPGARAVRPSTLPVGGGARVVVQGEGLAEGCRVRIGGIDVESAWLDATTLRAISPAHVAGKAAVEVLGPDGQITRLENAVTFDAGPLVEALVPGEGPPEGGTRVEVLGKGFQPGCVVAFFERHAPVVERHDETRLSFVTPPGELDTTGTVRVTNPDGLSGTMLEAFAYRNAPPPCIESVSPASAWTTGGLRLTVAGSGFRPGTRAFVAGAEADTLVKSATVLELLVPPRPDAGAAELRVVNPDGARAAAEGLFRYELPPQPAKLLGVAPARIFLRGGTIELHGDNFDAHTRVRVAEVQASVRVVSPTVLQATVAARELPGKVAVEVMNGSGVLVRMEDAFEYVAKPAPTVIGHEPKLGSVLGGTKVVLDGTGFERETKVWFGKEPAKAIAWKSASTLEVVAPAGKAAGLVDLVVATPDAVPVTLKNGYRYEALPAPTVQSVSPNRGGTAGGTELTVSGKGFVKESVVLVAGVPATKVKLVDPGTLEARTPPGKHGQMVDVVVRNPGGKEAVVRRAFAYDSRYD
ncbi:MAG: IPT/TIG domain-containing protein [Myxococcales bacterium]|nr:IPT/TIG domain-containing protein [Myxococcales bacterium]